MSHRILMIIAPDQFRDEELSIPRQAFQEQGWTVDVASSQTGQAHGMLGMVEDVEHDLSFAEIELHKNTYQALLVVGGMGSQTHLWGNEQLHRMLQTAEKQQHMVIGGICLSGAVLAEAGILKGETATVWNDPAARAIFNEFGVEYTGDPVTVNGRHITANGPDAAGAFAEALIEKLNLLVH